MNKYIIELDENAKEVVVISLEDGDMWTETMEVEDLEQLNSDYINEHFGDLQDTAYHRGLEEGNDIGYKNGVKDGQNEAWECAKRICLHPHNGGMTCTEISNAFGEASATQVLYKCSAQQAIEKLKAYEKKQADKIEVRDEVVWTVNEDIVIVVTRIYTINKIEWCDGFGKDGKVYSILTENARKTGRHFDIEKILEAMKA